MKASALLESLAPRRYRIGILIGMLLILAVFARRLSDTQYWHDSYPVTLAAALVFPCLYLSFPAWIPKVPRAAPFYFLVQALIVQSLGYTRPYEDVWAALYIPLGFQVLWVSSQRAIIVWTLAFACSIYLTLTQTMGVLTALGSGTYIIAIGIFLVSFDVLFAQTDRARQESQSLLEELRQAHHKLEDYAAQVKELAESQERLRLANELHDTVGQILFSITLHTQAARTLLEKEPARVHEQLASLELLTGQALAKMRKLIAERRQE